VSLQASEFNGYNERERSSIKSLLPRGADSDNKALEQLERVGRKFHGMRADRTKRPAPKDEWRKWERVAKALDRAYQVMSKVEPSREQSEFAKVLRLQQQKAAQHAEQLKKSSIASSGTRDPDRELLYHAVVLIWKMHGGIPAYSKPTNKKGKSYGPLVRFFREAVNPILGSRGGIWPKLVDSWKGLFSPNCAQD
jgi:hypothetical protein